MARKPNLFIVGAPKSGTTAMDRYLAAHPDIFMARRKEIHFFGSDLRFKNPRPTMAEYLKNFADAERQRWIGESSVWYLYSRRAALEIANFDPRARIIIMLRNPAEMIRAQHSQFLYNRNENIRNLRAALAAEAQRASGRLIPEGVKLPEGLLYRRTAQYYEQVQRYFKVFPRNQIHIIIFDDFVANTARVFEGLLDFLEIDSSFKPNFAQINRAKQWKSTAVLSVPAKVPEPVRRIYRFFPRSWRKRIWSLVKAANTSYGSREPLAEDLRMELEADLAPDIFRLSQLLGRDLSAWCQAASTNA